MSDDAQTGQWRERLASRLKDALPVSHIHRPTADLDPERRLLFWPHGAHGQLASGLTPWSPHGPIQTITDRWQLTCRNSWTSSFSAYTVSTRLLDREGGTLNENRKQPTSPHTCCPPCPHPPAPQTQAQLWEDPIPRVACGPQPGSPPRQTLRNTETQLTSLLSLSAHYF